MKNFKRIAIFVGHSKLNNGNYTSADGRSKGGKLEYAVCKELAYEISNWLTHAGQANDVIVCPEGKFASAKEESGYKLPIANSGKYDLVIELHLNSYNGTAEGAEVLCYPVASSREVGKRVQEKLATVFKSRGIKDRNDLYMLNKTKPVAIMLESFFCDSVNDCSKYDAVGKNELGRRIAEGLIDTVITKPSAPSTGDTFYRVIVASNTNKDASLKVLEEAKAKGFTGAFLATFNNPNDGKLYYRVVVGSYSIKENALKVLEEAKAKGFTNAFLDAFKK